MGLDELERVEPGHLDDAPDRGVAAPLTVINIVLPVGAAIAALGRPPGRLPAGAGRMGDLDFVLQAHLSFSLANSYGGCRR